jgi:predicted ester cyclase
MRRKMKKAPGIILLSFVICLVPGCRQQAGEQISKDEAKAIADQVLKLWNEGDLSTADALYGPGYVRHHPTPSAAASLADLKDTVISNRTLFPDYKLTFDEMIINGDRLIVFATMSGTNTAQIGEIAATGKKILMNGIYILRVADGKITEEWTYFNLLHYYLQLGYSLTPPEIDQSGSKQ